ncbi:MAG: tRNA adenosine(34) deaminase TadA [Clostridia bacterium]|nr:tRNA adenosine(34) deaminase TadA [Clostridia bacterium]MBR0537374.1 tRNA adenosine(34) deaminase TadA [Clostridia bacterium]
METGPDAATCRNTETESFDGPILGLTAPGELTEEQTDAYFMRAALKLAAEAAAEGEVPVGALIVHNGSVIACGRNRRELGKNALSHAELEAIDAACRTLGGWRLPRCTLYVTLEPCPMCAGAVINARIDRLVYGAADPKAGCAGSVTDLFAFPFNWKPTVVGGVLEEACAGCLSSFFRGLRQNMKKGL